MKQRPILIQGALQSEIDWLLEVLAPCTQREIGGFSFYEGAYGGVPVVISKTKMGEVCAAIATTLGLSQYRPVWILNQGTAGACERSLHTGDLVIGERVCYLAPYATAHDRESDPLNPWKTSGYRSLDGESISLATDERLLAWLRELDLPSSGSVQVGALGSGDVWTRAHGEIADHYERLGVLCEAMECTGVYMAANSRGVPAVSIRVISNNELLGERYQPDSGVIAQQYALALVKAWAALDIQPL